MKAQKIIAQLLIDEHSVAILVEEDENIIVSTEKRYITYINCYFDHLYRTLKESICITEAQRNTSFYEKSNEKEINNQIKYIKELYEFAEEELLKQI